MPLVGLFIVNMTMKKTRQFWILCPSLQTLWYIIRTEELSTTCGQCPNMPEDVTRNAEQIAVLNSETMENSVQSETKDMHFRLVYTLVSKYTRLID
jgi:hypothetical protein